MIKNASDYTLLAGQASVYVDGSFISRSDVPAVSPQESFDCPLGYVFVFSPHFMVMLILCPPQIGSFHPYNVLCRPEESFDIGLHEQNNQLRFHATYLYSQH